MSATSSALPVARPLAPLAGASRRVTVKDVAQHAGVQHSSVCVVLNGAKSNTHVSDAARERILAAAQELGYKRNGSMQAARTGRFGTAALLLSTHQSRSNLPQRIWEGIHDALAERDMALHLVRLPDEKLTDAGMVPKILREWMSDGMLIDYTNHIPPRMIELIRGHNLPAVWINSKQDADCVTPGDLAAGKKATQHLLELGHTRIAYADFASDPHDEEEHYSTRERRQGYLETMKAAGLAPRLLLGHSVPRDKRAAFFEEVLSEAERPTAFLTYGSIEPGVLLLAAARLNLEVPRDLSILTFGRPETVSGGYHLSCLTVPEYEVGQSAARMLLSKIEQPQQAIAPLVLPFGFDAGQTCAPVTKAR